MQQPIEHLGSAAVLFGDLRSCNQRIGITQLRFIAAPARRLLMQQAKQRIQIENLRMVCCADCRVVQFAEFLCHVLRNAVVFHIPLHRAPSFILQPDTGHILVIAALDETILAHTREPLAKITANVHEQNAFISHLMLDSNEIYKLTKQGLDAAQIAALKRIHPNLVLVKLLELYRMGYDLRHYYAQHHAFIECFKLPAHFRFDAAQAV